jgi:predicted MPP superfamily phosphohydrolase
MRIIGPFIFILCVLAFLGLVVILLLKYLNKNWWKNKIVRHIAIIMPFVGGVGIAIWLIGYFTRSIPISGVGSIITIIILITYLALIISLPVSSVFNITNRWLERRANKSHAGEPRKIDVTRRNLLKLTAMAFPATAVTVGGGGLANAFQKTNVYLLPLEFENLPLELTGMRILHLSDSHLGIYRMLDDFEEILTRADKFKPDIILFTGDIADELHLLPDALKMAASIKPKYGAYASLGNHEYYRGIHEVLTAFDKSEISLLRSSGQAIDIQGASLYLAGADDPVSMRKDNSAFLKRTVEKSLDGAPSEAFYLLISHRPESFDAASEFDINLTLAGHTHGGQVGLGGQSIWRNIMPNSYLWGKYTDGSAQMYLSSGIGHWLPFRLGCPPEAPIIELTQKS